MVTWWKTNCFPTSRWAVIGYIQRYMHANLDTTELAERFSCNWFSACLVTFTKNKTKTFRKYIFGIWVKFEFSRNCLCWLRWRYDWNYRYRYMCRSSYQWTIKVNYVNKEVWNYLTKSSRFGNDGHTPMEVDHVRQIRCFKCQKMGRTAKKGRIVHTTGEPIRQRWDVASS